MTAITMPQAETRRAASDNTALVREGAMKPLAPQSR
jgi:hypothetical protein